MIIMIRLMIRPMHRRTRTEIGVISKLRMAPRGSIMMNGVMGGWHWGFGFGHWIFAVLFWSVIILIVVALIKYLIKK